MIWGGGGGVFQLGGRGRCDLFQIGGRRVKNGSSL